MRNENNEIKYQLSLLDESQFNNSDRLIKVKLAPGTGINEEIQVGDDGVHLECVMGWNTGSFEYEIPAKKLIELLSKQPFNTIRSKDLVDYEFELISVEDGNLDYKKVNEIEIENEDEIIETLKNTRYEIDLEEGNDKYDLIREQMYDLYNRGEIGDSEYNFSSLFSLEFDDEELGSYFINWHYHESEWEAANDFLGKKDYQQAINLFKTYIAYESDDSKKIDALKKIAESYEELEDYRNALDYYDRLILLEPLNDYHLGHKAYALYKLNEFELSEEFYKDAIDINPSNIWAYSGYGDCLREQEKFDEAIEVFNQGIERNPEQPPKTTSLFWLHQVKAHSYYQLENMALAAESYEGAIDVAINQKLNKSVYALSYRRAAQAYYSLDKYELAIDYYLNSQEGDDDFKDTYTYYYLGESYRFIKDFANALESYKKCVALEEDETHPYAYKFMAFCALKLGDFESCVDYSEKGDPEAWNFYNCAQALMGLKQYTRAALKLQKALEIKPNDKWYNHEKGKAEFNLENYASAIECFDKVLEIDPNYKWSLQFKGDAHFELEQYDESLAAYEKMNEIDEYYIFNASSTIHHVLHNITLLYLHSNNFEKANMFFSKDNGYYFRKEGLWWHYCKKLSELNKKGDLFTSPKAVKLIDKLTINNIKDKALLSKIYLSRGQSDILHYEGENNGKIKLDLMISDLNKSLEINPSNHAAYLLRASYTSGFFSQNQNISFNDVLEKDKGLIDLNSAINDLETLLKAEDNAEGYILLIRCYSRNNDLNYLESTAIKAVSKFESDSKLWSCIGDEWKRNKEYKKAVVSYKKASALNSKSAWYWRQLGESYFHLQDFKNAIDAFNHSIEADPDNELYCYWLSKVYLADNQLGLAYSEINKAIASYSGVKDYFIQYAKVCGEMYKENQPQIGDLMIEYVKITAPQNGRTTENKQKRKEFLNACDSFNAAHCSGEGIKIDECDLKLKDEMGPKFFELWEHFLDVDIEEYIENASYKTKYHLSRNKSLKKEQILGLLQSGSFSILENAASNVLIDLKDIKMIIESDNESYNYSFKLLGVLSNPNIDKQSIDSLKNHQYNWVRKKAYSLTDSFDDNDLSDRYKVLGLIENPKIDLETKSLLNESLSTLKSVEHKVQFLTDRVTLTEFVVGELELNDVTSDLYESIRDGQDSWVDYVGSNWHEYGESEYGMVDTSIDLLISSNGKEEKITLSNGQRKTDNLIEVVQRSVDAGNFIHIADSTEVGEYAFNEFVLEFEFRPEELTFEYTDYQFLISGMEYSHLNGEDHNYSSGEIINTRAKGTDITLYFKSIDDLVDVTYYEDILNYIYPDGNNETVTEGEIKKYFEILLKQSKPERQETNHRETNITIQITGNGSEFNQGFITKDDYNKWLKHKETDQNWNEFCTKELSKDGYWDVSEISSFTGFNKDLISINIFINDQEFFSGNYNSLLDKFFEEEGEISQNINVSKNYGKYIFPKDGEWNTFFDNEEFEKRNKKLVTAFTSEQFDISTKIKTYKNFSIEKLGFALISTDELGYGKDFGDFIRDIKYDGIELDIEFPGGVGDISEINIS